MRLDETPYNTADGLHEFSRILEAALLEASRTTMHKNDVFCAQYALHKDSDTNQIGHTYYGRDLGKLNPYIANLWIGLDKLATNVSIVFTIIIDDNDPGSVQWLNKVRNALLNKNLCVAARQPQNTQKGFYIQLEQGKCDAVCGVLTPQHDKIKIVLDFIKDIDAIL